MKSKKRSKLYIVTCALLAAVFLAVMLRMSADLPAVGDPTDPANNEVSEFYLEIGPEETGALNAVTGMILHYRAFDTLGESCVLFIASVCVFMLLRVDSRSSVSTLLTIDRRHEPSGDPILSETFRLLIPGVFIFGIYVTLNGHLSPGGGFSGGAILGAGMILYLNAYGIDSTERFVNAKLYSRLTMSALLFYGAVKSYTFCMGANGLKTFESAGVPGRILSAGLILPLNICVAAVVSMTIYSIYINIRKGGFGK